jgi:glycosyltransferase involved in cell wall biosynthesis
MALRVCLVYDCLYPWTHGGAERWYRRLAELLAAAGHDVTYVTRRQWEDDAAPAIAGVRVVAVAAGGPLYSADGRRRVGPPLRFGAGVLLHLARNRRAYDVVHCSSFPYFSLLAARLALAGSGTRLFVDWLELWSAEYWRSYLGPLGGRVGAAVQAACVRLTPVAFSISPHTARRLRDAGLGAEPIVLPGLYSGPHAVEPALDPPRPPQVLFVGRHVPEKRAHLLPAAVAAAAPRVPELRGVVAGEGPERERVLEEIARLGVGDRVGAPGRLAEEEVAAAMRSASCLLLPSLREGYGIVVIEAMSHGTPAVVVSAPDSAASDLIVEGVNGFTCDPQPDAIAAAVVAAVEGGAALRRSTAEWFAAHVEAIGADAAARTVIAAYESAPLAERPISPNY